MALCDALRMMFSRQYASSASCQTQPFHALSCRRRGWRLRKLLQSVVFSVTHPFWKASTGRMWSMAAFAHVIFEWGYRRFHALRLVSKCSYTCSARQYRAQQHQGSRGRSARYLVPGFHAQVLENRLCLAETKPLESRQNGLGHPLSDVLLFVADRTACDSMELAESKRRRRERWLRPRGYPQRCSASGQKRCCGAMRYRAHQCRFFESQQRLPWHGVRPRTSKQNLRAAQTLRGSHKSVFAVQTPAIG